MNNLTELYRLLDKQNRKLESLEKTLITLADKSNEMEILIRIAEALEKIANSSSSNE